MKRNTILLYALSLLTIAWFSCTPKSEPVTEHKVERTPFESNIPTSCIFHETGRDGSTNQRINAVCAQALIDDYQHQIDSLKALNPTYPNIDNVLTYGAQIELDELRLIVGKIEEGGYDEVFAMMAGIPNKASEIIFVLKNTTNDSTAFYNFTHPCPDACPELK